MNPAPWFGDPNHFAAAFGSIAGAGGGSMCGLLGALAGAWAPRGKGKRLIVGGMVFFLFLGVVSFAVGLVALLSRQPFSIYYPFLLAGLIFSSVMGGLLPAVLKRYRDAKKNQTTAPAGRV